MLCLVASGGGARRLAWRAAVLCFTVFACVSAYKGLLGEASCGCFGKVAVNPWYTFALDVALVGLLLGFPPGQTTPGSKRAWRLPGWACVCTAVLVGVFGAFIMSDFHGTSPLAEGVVQGQGRLVLLLPEEWTGKRFPLFDQIDVGDRLAKGTWLVVLYHLDCGECLELIEQYQQSVDGADGHARGAGVAFIDVPQSGASGEKPVLDERDCLLGRLSESQEWFVSTPVLLTLQDGTVKEVDETGNAEVILAVITGNRSGAWP